MFPNTIKIANRTVKVIMGGLPDTLLGQYDPMTWEIRINDTIPKPMQIETFWHELVHAINDYMRFTEEIAKEMMAQESEEPIQDAFDFEEGFVENFAKVFLGVIQDNNLLPLTN